MDAIKDKAMELKSRCFDDPLEAEQVNYLSHWTLYMKQAFGAVPGMAKLIAHAFIPGLFKNSIQDFYYGYSDADKKKQ